MYFRFFLSVLLQFFITFRPAKHLDLIHSIFGQVVGGGATLDRMEAVGAKKDETPCTEIKIVRMVVFQNPIEEADELLRQEVQAAITSRLSSRKTGPLPEYYNTSNIKTVTNLESTVTHSAVSQDSTSGATSGVGKYMHSCPSNEFKVFTNKESITYTEDEQETQTYKKSKGSAPSSFNFSNW